MSAHHTSHWGAPIYNDLENEPKYTELDAAAALRRVDPNFYAPRGPDGRCLTEEDLPALVVKVSKIQKPKRLTEEDLGEILAAIGDASRAGIGTFHMPKFGNMKVKFDRNKQEYYINVR